MAVTKQYQGLGIGRLLVDSLVGEAKTRQAKTVLLATSPTLAVANHLYKSYGFRETDDDMGILGPYKRKSIVMKLEL